MREIKFRSWDGSKIDYEPLVSTYDPSVNDEFYFASSGQSGLVFMQYTGLKDKNGKEIYESDILEATGGELKSKTGKSKVVEVGSKFWVIFNEGSFRCCKSKANRKLHLNSANITLNGLCVIGNIYKNAELLKD